VVTCRPNRGGGTFCRKGKGLHRGERVSSSSEEEIKALLLSSSGRRTKIEEERKADFLPCVRGGGKCPPPIDEVHSLALKLVLAGKGTKGRFFRTSK